MTQYEQARACEIVDGYFHPHPCEKRRSAFERARQEAMSKLQTEINNLQQITAEQFLYATRRKDD